MTAILDQFNHAGFIPATIQDLFALRLAQKLGDERAADHYAALTAKYSEAHLLLAFRRAIRGTNPPDLGRRFHLELQKTQSNGYDGYRQDLISVRIERRAVAVAMFRGDHIEYADARQLSSARDKALASAVSFVSWVLARFSADSAVLEAIPSGYEFQRLVLHEGICRTIRDHMLPLSEVPKPVLLRACGYPALKSREQLRGVATSIWPVLEGTRAKVFIQDAAILGLHAQIERSFILN